jgi:hypothetical protein
VKTIGTFLDVWRDRALQGVGIPGDADTVSYILLGLHAEKYPADPRTDAMAFFSQADAAAERPVADHRAPAATRIERHRGDGGIDARAAALTRRGE